MRKDIPRTTKNKLWCVDKSLIEYAKKYQNKQSLKGIQQKAKEILEKELQNERKIIEKEVQKAKEEADLWKKEFVRHYKINWAFLDLLISFIFGVCFGILLIKVF